MTTKTELKNSASWVTFTACPPGASAKAGTIIGTIACHNCGNPAHVKLDMNLKAYSYCNSHHPENYDPCGASIKWPRMASQKMIAAWARNPTTTKEIAPDATKTVDPAPAGASPEPAAQPRAEKPARVRKPKPAGDGKPAEPAKPAGDGKPVTAGSSERTTSNTGLW